jgi:hypothetical protein
VIVIDEYLAVRVLRGQWPDGLPDDDLALIDSRCYRGSQQPRPESGAVWNDGSSLKRSSPSTSAAA